MAFTPRPPSNADADNTAWYAEKQGKSDPYAEKQAAAVPVERQDVADYYTEKQGVADPYAEKQGKADPYTAKQGLPPAPVAPKADLDYYAAQNGDHPAPQKTPVVREDAPTLVAPPQNMPADPYAEKRGGPLTPDDATLQINRTGDPYAEKRGAGAVVPTRFVPPLPESPSNPYVEKRGAPDYYAEKQGGPDYYAAQTGKGAADAAPTRLSPVFAEKQAAPDYYAEKQSTPDYYAEKQSTPDYYAEKQAAPDYYAEKNGPAAMYATQPIPAIRRPAPTRNRLPIVVVLVGLVVVLVGGGAFALLNKTTPAPAPLPGATATVAVVPDTTGTSGITAGVNTVAPAPPTETPLPALNPAAATAAMQTRTARDDQNRSKTPQQLYDDGNAALKAQKWDDAISSFSAIIQRPPGYLDAAALLARAYYGRATNTDLVGDPAQSLPKALDDLTEAKKYAAGDDVRRVNDQIFLETGYRDGLAALNVQHWADAVKALQPVYDKKPDHRYNVAELLFRAYVGLGDSLSATDPAQATNQYTAALALKGVADSSPAQNGLDRIATATAPTATATDIPYPTATPRPYRAPTNTPAPPPTPRPTPFPTVIIILPPTRTPK